MGNEIVMELSMIVRGHLEIFGSLANPRRTSQRGLELIRQGKVQVDSLITHRFSLEEFPKAWKTFVEHQGGAIRVMMHP